MSDSEYDSDSSISSLNLSGDNNLSDIDDYDDSDSESLGLADYYNKGGKKSNSKKNSKKINLSRDDETDNETDNDDFNEDDDEDNNDLEENDEEDESNSENEDNESDNNKSDNEDDDINETETENDSDSDNESDSEKENIKDEIIKKKINKNINQIVNKKDRITRPYLTKYEYVRCLGERTQQITAGAKIMIKNADELLKFKSPEDIAKLEIINKCCPYIIIRPLPNHKEEHWDINELDILFPII